VVFRKRRRVKRAVDIFSSSSAVDATVSRSGPSLSFDGGVLLCSVLL
jgi:hypothetical protein